METKESNLSWTGYVQISYSRKPSHNEEGDPIKSSLGVLANRKVATKEVEDVKQNVTQENVKHNVRVPKAHV